MFAILVRIIYRILAILLVLMPIVVNFIVQGGIISSLVYVPVSSLLLASFFVYFEKINFVCCPVQQYLQGKQRLSKQNAVKITHSIYSQ